MSNVFWQNGIINTYSYSDLNNNIILYRIRSANIFISFLKIGYRSFVDCSLVYTSI